jgi:hypothetical protein
MVVEDVEHLSTLFMQGVVITLCNMHTKCQTITLQLSAL